jgi:hypothetical protein
MGTSLPETCWATSKREVEALRANRSWQHSRSHGLYQHKAIASRILQLLIMGTWMPETCWATSTREVDALTANRFWQPSRSHGKYQHKSITSRTRQLLMMGTWLPETCWATIIREIKNTKVTSMDALPTNRTWQPPCSHGTYQHKAITSRSRQLLMMGTRLPETCWTTIRREIKNRKVTSSWFFLSTSGTYFGPQKLHLWRTYNKVTANFQLKIFHFPMSYH